jgi:hypothetical protein
MLAFVMMLALSTAARHDATVYIVGSRPVPLYASANSDERVGCATFPAVAIAGTIFRPGEVLCSEGRCAVVLLCDDGSRTVEGWIDQRVLLPETVDAGSWSDIVDAARKLRDERVNDMSWFVTHLPMARCYTIGTETPCVGAKYRSPCDLP